MPAPRLPIGFSRLRDIIGDSDATPPRPGMFPFSRSGWWAGVASGKFPPAVKFGPNTTAWRNEQLQELIDDPDAPIEARSWHRNLSDAVGSVALGLNATRSSRHPRFRSRKRVIR